jgi:putative aldouronate transport system substrate-binding protein
MPLYTDISTYVKEMQIKFIIGKESLADFDKYVQKVQKMGLDEVLKIKQSQYDDFLNRK